MALSRWGIAATLAAAAAGIAAGCDSPTEPTAVAAPIHDTLNPGDSRARGVLYESAHYIDQFGRQVDGAWAIDDFTPSRTTRIQTMRWQGGYCDPRFQVPLAIPAPAARGFRVLFTEERSGGPAALNTPNISPLIEVTIPASQVREEKMFDLLNSLEFGCGSKFPAPFAYYTYTAALPTPLPVAEGRRYWFRVMADMGQPTVMWGWRGGPGGDGRAFSSYANAVYNTDMAFALFP